jgi:AcrR family transcriptional regulator
MKTATRRYSQNARALSAEATGQRIVDAFLALLMTQWLDEITLDRVAEDAGVTVQTVIRRFGSKDGLLAGSVKALGERVNAQRATPRGDVGRVVDHLLKDYEQTGDAIIRLLALELRHPALTEILYFGRREHRQWVTNAFADSLSKLEAKTRERAIDALVLITDVYSWKLLRRDMERSVAATAMTMKQLILASISEFSAIK